MTLAMKAGDFLPVDGYTGTLVGRIWQTGLQTGPTVVAIRAEGVFDVAARFPTMSTLLETDQPALALQKTQGIYISSLEEILANTDASTRNPNKAYFLAPCDLQVVKACGVTFATSMIERVIEEQAGGDPTKAHAVRVKIQNQVGCDFSQIKPGSAQAIELKKLLQEQGIWSQYLEVGIGPDAEVFTKAPVLSALGTGSDIGIRSDSSWNNPEPEVVLAVNSKGEILGASLGNDVNLRDIEGRSALLLGKAKDNNASCAIGPYIRLFDKTFSLNDLRKEELQLRVEGDDAFVLNGINSMAKISRDPTELVRQTMAAHQYPDGFMLFLGTLFSPTQDRDELGHGFTHKLGDKVSIRSKNLGQLINRVTHSELAAPWQFGIRAFFNNLYSRGLFNKDSVKCL
jgi:fumarylacetoacetate (FAA) hydrolase family protein